MRVERRRGDGRGRVAVGYGIEHRGVQIAGQRQKCAVRDERALGKSRDLIKRYPRVRVGGTGQGRDSGRPGSKHLPEHRVVHCELRRVASFDSADRRVAQRELVRRVVDVRCEVCRGERGERAPRAAGRNDDVDRRHVGFGAEDQPPAERANQLRKRLPAGQSNRRTGRRGQLRDARIRSIVAVAGHAIPECNRCGRRTRIRTKDVRAAVRERAILLRGRGYGDAAERQHEGENAEHQLTRARVRSSAGCVAARVWVPPRPELRRLRARTAYPRRSHELLRRRPFRTRAAT